MRNFLAPMELLLAVPSVAALFFPIIISQAQAPVPRITAEIDNSQRTAIKGSHPPMARAEIDAGRMPAGTKLQGISVVFSRTAAQEADLETLIAAQQDPTSPLYHKWLTPDEFAARFAVADSDIAKVQSWLEAQGFTVDAVSRSKNRITFSGTVDQVERAFATELHYYSVDGKKEYAPAADISVPVALASLVQTVKNLSTFRPHPRVRFNTRQRTTNANFTSAQSGHHFLMPNDIATIYDINPVYHAGYTGTGQSIAVVGQSEIVVSDIEHFQTAAGFSIKDPELVLVPSSGRPAISPNNEAESDLDLEYSSTIAQGATVYFVYVGDNPQYSIWDSIQYAVENKVAPIISDSYGVCETALSATDYSTLNDVLAQAASQGQTVVVPAGDNGSTDCYGENGLTADQWQALAVDFPASSQYVTGLGGTEFPAADVATSNTTYWQSANGNDVTSSALSYIPEQVWNDDSARDGIASGGGGVSTLTARPSWQTGVPGIPSGNYRLVPDLSLTASADDASYLYCTSDTTAWSSGQQASCNSGFRDSATGALTAAGGTSFAVPIFAGLVAIINDKLNSTGQGMINPTLYSLAASSTNYASAFHDITSGGNQCTAGSNYCSSAGASEYPAATGYDEASGLGSIDFNNLLAAWPASPSSATAPSKTTLSAATMTPAPGAGDTISITVTSASSSTTTTPTGTLTIVVDGTTETFSLALSNGSGTYNFSSTTLGSHTITATYSGDSIYASSSGSLTVTVTSASKSFTLSANNVTVASGNAGTSKVTITPKNGYTGTISFTVSSSPSLSHGCFSLPNAAVTGSAAVTATLTIYTSSSACASGSLRGNGGANSRMSLPLPTTSHNGPLVRLQKTLGCIALAGLLLAGLSPSRSRKLGVFAASFVFVIYSLWTCGCGGVSPSTAERGTYTVTITGTDTSSSSLSSSTTIILMID